MLVLGSVVRNGDRAMVAVHTGPRTDDPEADRDERSHGPPGRPTCRMEPRWLQNAPLGRHPYNER